MERSGEDRPHLLTRAAGRFKGTGNTLYRTVCYGPDLAVYLKAAAALPDGLLQFRKVGPSESRGAR